VNEYFLLGVAITLAGYAAHRFMKKPMPTKIIAAKAEIYQRMDDVLAQSPVQRFLIFRTSNGGGTPKVGTPIYSYALYERVVYPFSKRAEEYQRVPLDAHYIGCLLDVKGQDYIILDTDRLPLDAMIHGLYKADGVSRALWFYLCENKDSVFYASIAVDAKYKDEIIQDEHLWKYKRTIAQIRKIFEQYAV